MTEYQGSFWCYISSDSQCSDKKGTKRKTDGLRYWSAQACQSKELSQNQEKSNIVFPDQEKLENEFP